MSGIRSIYRGSAQRGFATATSAPIRVDSTSGLLILDGAGSGSTETTLVDTGTAQTLAAKTLTSPIINAAAYTEVVAASGGTTRILTGASSGSVNLFDISTTNILYTLPAPVVGLQYNFLSTVLQTSGTIKIITDAGTTYLNGAIQMFSGEKVTPSSTLGPMQFNSPAASNFISFNMNGTTTGGGIGTWVSFLCVSATAWLVTGIVVSPSGTLATPFANS